jgi:hypothetical protein
MTTRAAWPSLLLCVAVASSFCTSYSTLPQALSDQDFWTLVETLSEPPGTFDVSENLVSNEPDFVDNARRLRGAGGVYIGVGPEQNFSYIARLRPAMAFIVDIRKENRNLHLLYKALFALSSDRADFVSRLFSRPRPARLGSTATIDEIFERFETVPPTKAILDETSKLVRQRLVTTHRFAMAETDLASLERALVAFANDGPEIHFWGARAVDDNAIRPSYRQLMAARDVSGQPRSFLASVDAFAFVKDLQSKNRIVPLVGDFAGPTALRRVGDYVRSHRDAVQAFYASNVGVYLNSRQTLAFCANLLTLPAASTASFIERDDVRPFSVKLEGCTTQPTR